MSDNLLIQEAPATVLENQILSTLAKYYPAWADLWRVTVDYLGGMVTVRNIGLSGQMGFMIKITSVDPEGKAIMRAGGELLERYRVARKRAIDIRETLTVGERNYRGNLTYER